MQRIISRHLEKSSWWLSVWGVSAAFGTYSCMYAFRKPFTAAPFSGQDVFGWDLKSALISSQVIGYLISKLIGIRVIAEMPPQRRAAALIGLISISHLALALFAVLPAPWNVLAMFINGLPLGLVFGLVLGFLEGRRLTEFLSAGLCASFILASGVSKTLGSWLLQAGVSESWMPFAAGSLFYLPMLGGVWMLTCIPPPDAQDVGQRSQREPMTRVMRMNFLAKYAVGMGTIAGVYFLTTILRSVRDDFGPELWQALGTPAMPADYAWTDLWVAVMVLALNSLSILIIDNRRALLASIALSAVGAGLILLGLWLQQQQRLGPMGFMVLVGLGLYLPYVAIHTTIFERMIATTRDRGNIGFLMYIVDSFGYLGYVALMLGRPLLPRDTAIFPLFFALCLISGSVMLLLLAIAAIYFWNVRSQPGSEEAAS